MNMDVQEYLNELVAKARTAQEAFAKLSQEDVDKAVRAIGKAVYDHAEELAHMAVDETRMGRYDSKKAKCENKSKSTGASSSGTRSTVLSRWPSPLAWWAALPPPPTRSSTPCITPCVP